MANNRMLIICDVCHPKEQPWPVPHDGRLMLAKFYPDDWGVCWSAWRGGLADLCQDGPVDPATVLRRLDSGEIDQDISENGPVHPKLACEWIIKFQDWMDRHKHDEVPHDPFWGPTHYRLAFESTG